MSTPGLTEFQIELANTFFSLPESAGFLLAGGGALIAQGIVPRPTEDLDFFTARQLGNVEAASEALTTAVAARGWTTDLLRSGPDFRRWAITGPETVLVDLAVDSPSTGTPTLTIAGPALDPADLVVRKTMALFGRAEPRDYIDYVLNQRFNRDDTLSKAVAADQGFNQSVCSWRPCAPTKAAKTARQRRFVKRSVLQFIHNPANREAHLVCADPTARLPSVERRPVLELGR